MPSSTKEQQEAVAETIENNIAKEIVERSQSNPKYYETMSALLKELFARRKQDVLNLIDGDELARLMFEHGIGVRVHKTMEIKRLDLDFFSDLEE